MGRLTITAQTFLEWEYEPPITVGEYFNCGGSLADVVSRVKALINSDSFSGNYGLRRDVRNRIDACVQYVQTLPPEGAVVRFWRSWLGGKDDRSYIEEAQRFWVILSNNYISPLTVSAILEPEVTLESAVRIVFSRVLGEQDGRELFYGNHFYRSELRDRLYSLAKEEWEYQSQSLSGILKRTVEYASHWWGARSALDRAFEIIKLVDNLSGKILVQPMRDHFDLMSYDYKELNFKNSAWLTDTLLSDFAATMLRIERIHLQGCFQVTQAGIKAAEDTRKQASGASSRGYRLYPLEITTEFSDDWVMVDYVYDHAPLRNAFGAGYGWE